MIANEDRFVSINATTEVDLVGQCASETVAGRYWSSSGGQADFARGAMYSTDGQAFVVLPSTAADGEISRIRATLTPGSMVTTIKNTVDHIVTEYGVAEMRGTSLSQRAAGRSSRWHIPASATSWPPRPAFSGISEARRRAGPLGTKVPRLRAVGP